MGYVAYPDPVVLSIFVHENQDKQCDLQTFMETFLLNQNDKLS